MEHPRISRDPAIMMGKPCVTGTRLTVEHILRALSQGVSIDVVLEEYPRLKREDVLAAVAYAADYLRQEGLIAA
ncbi:hypothetical protein KOAAANKH_02673 [Brevundimonas sp. NIBR10]|uniref:DUF433 domain-containing protein n=1 Tax=Brevundimonas sp. NIBR10 TaxID=3015997 RepID=UPI0022F1568A|nr:DUF433 domain-containing protein [Brevundimonas sp. NIBR10]WGM47788.1 hypothetical protein KOAAANKH_02673 [Brevundimonas sp. NIBR10]